ncbi:hypothetical protein [Streptomyces sp. NPDC008137]|uniref:hypothetical protein n=1 Tax=Streptomyces sp. NPDC008137 TaxID=3364813 RepID=UPI0036EEB443
MTDRPYTDDDLRAEAARQYKNATEDPDFSGIGEQMEGHKIPSRDDFQWDQLGDHDFDTAMRAVDNLLSTAVDASRWAVELGADGLQPSNEHAITIDGNGAPIARIHFAFEPGMPESMRSALVEGIGGAIADAL